MSDTIFAVYVFLASAVGFGSGVVAVYPFLRTAREDLKATRDALVFERREGNRVLNESRIEARRFARLLRPPVKAEFGLWALWDCKTCQGHGFTSKSACACIQKSAIYRKAVKEGRVVELRRTPWVAEVSDASEAA